MAYETRTLINSYTSTICYQLKSFWISEEHVYGLSMYQIPSEPYGLFRLNVTFETLVCMDGHYRSEAGKTETFVAAGRTTVTQSFFDREMKHLFTDKIDVIICYDMLCIFV